MRKNHQVIYSPQAFKDLTELYEYICFHLQAPETAENQASRIRTGIRSLDIMPNRHPLVSWEPWASIGIRQMPIDNYIVFYRVDEKQTIVTIIRIFYSRRNIESIIKNASN